MYKPRRRYPIRYILPSYRLNSCLSYRSIEPSYIISYTFTYNGVPTSLLLLLYTYTAPNLCLYLYLCYFCYFYRFCRMPIPLYLPALLFPNIKVFTLST